MSFTMDGLQAKLDAARDAVRQSAETRLQEAAERAVQESGYLAAQAPETNDLPVTAVLERPNWSGTVVVIDIRTVEDWQLEPGVHHCYDPAGKDCPTFAAEGPYTLDTEPAQPGDGTTPCHDYCYCAMVPRPLNFTDPTADVAAAIAGDLASTWRT